MSTLQKPNSNQASKNSLAGVTKDVLQRWLREEVDDMLPARVVSYDDNTGRATIQPIVMVGTTDGTKISRAAIPNIHVFRFGGGGFFIRFPVKPGDFGWLKANDRDISLIMQNSGQVEDWPNTKRLHSFSDAMFFPDILRAWVIDGANADAAVFQTLDGSAVLAVHSDKLVLEVGPSSIEVSASGVAIVSPPGTLTHNGINVGDTHVHVGSPSAPTGPVSNTGAPIA